MDCGVKQQSACATIRAGCIYEFLFFGWWLERCAQIAGQCPGPLFFCLCETSKSFLLWLAGCQVPRPQCNHFPPPPPPPKVQFQTPPILKRSETYNGNFQGLYAQERAPTRPTNPHQHRHPAQNPSSFLPPSPFPPAFSLESKGSESSWKVKYSLWALSSKLSQTPTPQLP